MLVSITNDPIDLDGLLKMTRNENAGAIVTFQGTVRRFTGDMEVKSLLYESYREMAEKTIGEIVGEAIGRFGVIDINVIHRIGEIGLTEDSVAISVASAHRKDAFRACEYVIDEIKSRVPIWKMDIKPEGTGKWRD